jgi:hypothetical protein
MSEPRVYQDLDGELYVHGESLTTIRQALAASKLNGTLEAYKRGFRDGLRQAVDTIEKIKIE